MPSAVIETLLRAKKGDFASEAGLLQMGMAHATAYAQTRYDEAPPRFEIKIDFENSKLQDSDRSLWMNLLTDDAYLPLLDG